MANTSSGWAGRASGALSGLRDRFSGNRNRDDEYDDYGYEDDYDNYGDGYNDYDDRGYSDDYGEYGYDPEAEEDYDMSSTGPVSTRSVNNRTQTRSTNPRLVSMSDARASVTGRTSAIDPETRVPSYRQTPSTTGYRTASAGAGASRSRGYDSLFTSTASTSNDSQATGADGDTKPKSPVFQIPLTKAPGDRSLEIVRPKEYGDVANVAGILRKGDAVILSLIMAPAAISIRVLDFAFGVASALDANVECIGDKVFFVVRGEGMSEAEREKLRLQGVVQ
ncbi:MAG: cell division protein SepF [Eggerthellaceae bacterium]